MMNISEKLSAKHMEHMDIYGEDNDQRLSGAHETSPYDEFSVGVGNGEAVAWLYRHGNVLSRSQTDQNVQMRVSINGRSKARFDQLFGLKQA